MAKKKLLQLFHDCKTRLRRSNLSLLKRRLLGDLTQVLKMFRGFDSVHINDYLTDDRKRTTRNKGSKITGKLFQIRTIKGLQSEIQVNNNTVEIVKNWLRKPLENSTKSRLLRTSKTFFFFQRQILNFQIFSLNIIFCVVFHECTSVSFTIVFPAGP